MKLRKLFKDVKNAQIKSAKDPEITGICSNSKLVAPGNLFIAKKGFIDDGSLYIIEAVAAGAGAILTDMYDPSLKQAVQIIHPAPDTIEGHLASIFHRNPSEELFMVGVTGTNGKTTTSFFLKYLMDQLSGQGSGLIGTIEYIVGQHRYQAVRTTPDVLTNQKMLRDMCNHGCKSAVMEVTSHALTQGRVDNIDFDAAVFTNLTLDHLDYHGTMDAYCSAKNLLFRNLGKNKKHACAVVNNDSGWLGKIVEGCTAKILTYAIEGQADLKASTINLTPKGTEFQLHYEGDVYPVSIPLVGRFNVYNCLASIGVCLVKGEPLQKILPLLAKCPPIPGRLEAVSNNQELKIYVDFAHTDDALENVLETLAELKSGKIITVFGCGGDRDKSKRPRMGKVAEKYSDHVIITSDNPRSEVPEQICIQVAQGFIDAKKYQIEIDRKKAIHLAIKMAKPEDIVLIAGKGHEISQVFAHKTIEFNDRKVAEELCQSR